jgi:hypothetical protein
MTVGEPYGTDQGKQDFSTIHSPYYSHYSNISSSPVEESEPEP